MTDTQPPLLSIGEFSSRSRLSIRMLRHYDEHGVLTPAEVDERSGYRRYRPEQLADAVQIRRLRDVGFSVSAIAAVLASRGSDAYDRALRLQREALASQLHEARQRLDLIDQLLDQEGHTMNAITVTCTTVAARTVVTLRGTVPTYDQEGQLWGRFIPALEAQGITPIGAGGSIEHNTEYREADVDESVWLPVAPGTTATEPLEVLDLPEQDVIMARVEGPFSLISEAHARIQEFATEQGLTFAARDDSSPVNLKVFNRYLTDPSQVPEEAQLTEVCVPLG